MHLVGSKVFPSISSLLFSLPAANHGQAASLGQKKTERRKNCTVIAFVCSAPGEKCPGKVERRREGGKNRGREGRKEEGKKGRKEGARG